MKTIFKHLGAACAVTLAFGVAAQAQEYPNRPVKVVVGYVPGGAPDMVARALSQKLGEILGQPFVVENKPGAGGVLATSFVSKSAPDGYTLLLGETGQLVVAPFVYKNGNYSPLTDLTPVAMLTSEPLLIVSGAKTSIKTLQDLIRESKAHPGKIAYGSSGVGTIHHIAGEVFRAEAGLDMMHVPYKGSGQSVPAVLAGDVPVLVTSFPGAGAHVRSGAVHLLAVTSPERLPQMPNVPAVSELIKGYDFQSEMGVLAPPGLPPETLSRLSVAIKKALESPDFVTKFKDTATQVSFKSSAEYTQNLRRNLQKYEQAVKLAKVQPQ